MVKRNQLSLPQPSLPIEEQCKSLIKNLASCKQTIRDRSLRTVLRTWLPEQTSIPDESMKKLWQGLFYCLWHADKSLYQSELIDRLAAALQSLPLPPLLRRLPFHNATRVVTHRSPQAGQVLPLDPQVFERILRDYGR
ncbi:hypothetical protein Bca101_001022 [Brassica carinata]